MEKFKNIGVNYLWCSILIEELIRLGVKYFIISPGSRSAPLTISAAKNKKAKCLIAYDERSAAFLAIGYAKISKFPAVLICSSGTAVANYFPAIVEAKMDHLPLIVISADRPPELQDTYSNQTINQIDIFGKYVKSFANLPIATIDIPPAFVLTTIDKLFYDSLNFPVGPVHLNCYFREPLTGPLKINRQYSKKNLRQLDNWHLNRKVYSEFLKINFDYKLSIKYIKEKIITAEFIFIILGRIHAGINTQAIFNFLEIVDKHNKIIVFRDGLSNVYFKNSLNELTFYSSDYKVPDLIISIGMPSVSKKIIEAINIWQSYQILITPHNSRINETHNQLMHIPFNDIKLFTKLYMSLKNYYSSHKKNSKKNVRLKNVSKNVFNRNRVKNNLLKNYNYSYFELTIFNYLLKAIKHKIIYCGNSNTIRNVNKFYTNKIIIANRGTSGIDGTLASAIGARLNGNAVTVITGDLSIIHDLSSFSLLREIDDNFKIIIINNYGGGIFSLLPVYKLQKFRKYFITPHNINFTGIADNFKIKYLRATNIPQLKLSLKKLYSNNEIYLLEVIIDIKKNKLINDKFLNELYKK